MGDIGADGWGAAGTRPEGDGSQDDRHCAEVVAGDRLSVISDQRSVTKGLEAENGMQKSKLVTVDFMARCTAMAITIVTWSDRLATVATERT